MFQLYDTRTRQVETIEPAGRGMLRMYSCGPAGFRRAHIGDLRSYLIADLIRRNAEHRHHLTVLTCQNVSDVAYPGDGGRIDPAAEEQFRADCSALNLRPPENSPRSSELSGPIVDMIGRLVEAGHAYPAPGGSVYFDARSFPGYGELSGHGLAEAGPGHQPGGEGAAIGGADEVNAATDGTGGKRFPADWALWTGAPADGQTWTAPWGSGLPARSVACSALSLHYLGDIIDIHTGGTDRCFPHHEHERAQSDTATGHEVVRHWVHGEQLRFGGAAIAASAGKVVVLDDLADRGLDPLALRLEFLGHSYREPVNLSWEALGTADAALRRWRELVAEWAQSPSKPLSAPTAVHVAAAFDDDLDTPAALAALHRLEQDTEAAPGAKFETFAHADQLLGLDLARDIGRGPARRQSASG